MKLCVISFTENGRELSSKIRKKLTNHEIETFFKPTLSDGFIEKAFSFYEGLIFICAVGISVRLIAPYIKSKTTDPCVIVLDEKGTFTIPILSGHLGGGNELSSNISMAINSIEVITTATDINKKTSIDVFAKKNNLHITDFEITKKISAHILNHDIGLVSDYEVLNIPKDIHKNDKSYEFGICISDDDKKKPFNTTLSLLPKNIILGVGCKKNTETELFEQFLLSEISDIRRVREIRTIDIKQNEECILHFSKKYRIPLKILTKQELLSVSGEFSSSEFVKSITGVDCVCERSAAYGGNEIIKKKTSREGMTLSYALEEWSGNFEY